MNSPLRHTILSDTMEWPGRSEATSALVDYVEGTLEALSPCSAGILLSREGVLLSERYLKGREAQDPSAPIDCGSLWPWWSVTKSVTAALVARLVYSGLLSLDQALSSVLPEFREHGAGAFDKRTVTLRSLLCHSSGCALPGRIEDGIHLGGNTGTGVNVDVDIDLAEVVVVTKPGSAFVYSALGMHILERFLEALTGRGYEELLHNEILEPFGLGSLCYFYDSDIAAGAAARALPCIEARIVPSQRRQHCGLGLYGTARDLLTFGERWLSLTDASGSRWCSPELRSEIWSPHSRRTSDNSDYGLLWWIFPEAGGYVASGASFSVCGVLPRGNIVVAVARNHFGPTKQPFDYRADKLRILELASALAI